MKKYFVSALIIVSCLFLSAGCARKAEPTPQAENSAAPCATAEPEETKSPRDNITIDIITSSEDYKDDDGEILLSFSGASASVTINDNTAAADLINASLTSEYDALITQTGDYVSLAENEYHAYKAGQSSYWNSYYFARNIAVGRSDSKVISLLFTDDYYLGGAHGGASSFARNYAAETGKALTLADLAEDKETLISVMIPYLLRLTQKPGFADGLSWADEDTFRSIIADGSWYFLETGIVIICNEYSIGPYVIGTNYLEVPYEELSGILRDKWLPDNGA